MDIRSSSKGGRYSYLSMGYTGPLNSINVGSDNMVKDIVNELRDAVMTPGVSGYEDKVRDLVRKKTGAKNIEEDNIGNLILRLGKKGNAPSLAIVAHMDEVGLIVSNILDDGTLKFKKVGGIHDEVLIARGVNVHTDKGNVNGTIGFPAPHLKLEGDEKTKATWDKMVIDVGTRSRKEAEKLGIRLLDPITIKKDFFLLNDNIICTKSLDNRAGVTALLQVYENIKNIKFKGEVSLVWSVQEEMGLRGARVIANTMDFDYVIALDTYSSTDCPGLGNFYEPKKLGDGPVLRMVDVRVIATPKFRDMVEKIAKKEKIPYQIGVTGGSTDGMAMQESGSATLPIGIPMRYTHSPTECIHIDDLKNLIKFVTAVVKDFQK
jgi:putative aminopeptidase FrvX